MSLLMDRAQSTLGRGQSSVFRRTGVRVRGEIFLQSALAPSCCWENELQWNRQDCTVSEWERNGWPGDRFGDCTRHRIVVHSGNVLLFTIAL
ncbi:hypothetical protein SKAU_G00309270 [Synaphobranchus kaupii]|uniref:Uncharacterized protein n=1 Tax=Synaphobranchus kaupii TaxID=118154 RepID=A0A9Q1ERC4_SYNKA|nr:hypothetical protein SKAU_G00309270 [Synaphobranchus kaupii]